MNKRGCDICKFGVYDGGDPDVGIFPYYDCDNQTPEIERFMDENTDIPINELASKCPCFESKVQEKCGECGKMINLPWSNALWYSAGWEIEPVCSKECSEASVRKFRDFDDEYEDMMKREDGPDVDCG